MNQTKKRLKIINIAISISDMETIQLQILKLRLLHTDEKIQEILLTLENNNHAQAQGLISTYIETPNKEILQRTFQEAKKKQNIQDKNVIDEFDLFKTDQYVEKSATTNTLDLNEMIAMQDSELTTVKHETVNFDSLLEITSDEILKDNISIDLSHQDNNDFWEEKEEIVLETKDISKDTFFDKEIDKDIDDVKAIEEMTLELKTEEIIEDVVKEDEVEDDLKELKTTKQDTSKPTDVKYNSITYIDQKLKNMQTQYPTIEDSGKRFESVDNWIMKISNDGYTEHEVEDVIKHIDKIKSDNPEEAANLLLISAATESKYAQFMLARALFKGDIIKKNSEEAFTLINRLAVNDDYPEAICDLAQFYEHGIGITKDKYKAEALYKEAMSAGIKRAMEHFTRLQKQNKGFLSFLTK